METPIERPAARILLLDPDLRLLLFRISIEGREVWITPGGGLDPGETHEECALRELWEETGYRATSLGPCVWHRSHVFSFRGARYAQHERFFLQRLAEAVVVSDEHWEELERDFTLEHRWWTIDDIEASSERFAPRALAGLLRTLLTDGVPHSPITVEV